MEYYYSTKLSEDFEAVVDLVTAKLKDEGFGILTEIDVKETLKQKLDVDFKKYKILGACNPQYAHKAILAEDKIGVFLPCNIIVEENRNGEVEVAAVSPKASMKSVENDQLNEIATEIEDRLQRVIKSLK